MPGSLKKRGKNSWQARWYSHTDIVSGRKVKRYATATIHAPNEREAQRQANLMYADVVTKSRPPAVGTIGDLLERRRAVETMKGRSESTIHKERAMVERIGERFGDTRLVDLTAFEIQQWLASLVKQGLSPSTAHHHFRVLRAMLREAEQWDLIPISPDRKVKVRKPADKESEVPDDEGVLTILSMAEHSGQTIGVAVRLAAATGYRRGEMIALRWRDIVGDVIHLQNNVVEGRGRLVETVTKGKKSGETALDVGTLAILLEHQTWQERESAELGGHYAGDDARVLANLERDPSGHTHYNPSWLTSQWRRLANRAGYPGARLHDVRHWHMTALHDRGVDLLSIKDRARHADASLTARVYVHPKDKATRGAAAIIGTILDR